MAGKTISNFDRDTILLQIHPQVTTRRLVLVGHSQGALYSNALYDYLLAHGEPRAAVGVYQVGSPASAVAGGGRYLNSSGDAMLGMLRGLGFTFLPDNIDLVSSLEDAQKKYPGHSFSGAYLAEAPERVVGDLQATLGALKAESATDKGECFTAPDSGVGYKAAKAGFAVADTAAAGVKAGVGAAQVAAVAAGQALASAAQGAYGLAGKVATDIGITVGGVAGLSKATEPESRPTNFDIFSKLYGSSLTKDEYVELLGSAVATAPAFDDEPAAQEDAQAAAPKKITYLSGSHRSRANNEPREDAVETPAEAPEPAPATQEATAPTEPASTTPELPEPATTTPVATITNPVPALSPVVDSFDSYDGSGWTPYGGSTPVVLLATTSPDCRSGGCAYTGQEIGNGGLGNAKRMYKTGTAVSEGSLVIWKKHHVGWRGVANVMVYVCVGAPSGGGGGSCDGLINGSISGTPDLWHQYYLVWRNNGDAKEFCTLRDDTDQSHCSWQASSSIAASQSPDTVVITGDAVRPDLGDRLWFDDLGTP